MNVTCFKFREMMVAQLNKSNLDGEIVSTSGTTEILRPDCLWSALPLLRSDTTVIITSVFIFPSLIQDPLVLSSGFTVIPADCDQPPSPGRQLDHPPSVISLKERSRSGSVLDVTFASKKEVRGCKDRDRHRHLT